MHYVVPYVSIGVKTLHFGFLTKKDAEQFKNFVEVWMRSRPPQGDRLYSTYGIPIVPYSDFQLCVSAVLNEDALKQMSRTIVEKRGGVWKFSHQPLTTPVYSAALEKYLLTFEWTESEE